MSSTAIGIGFVCVGVLPMVAAVVIRVLDDTWPRSMLPATIEAGAAFLIGVAFLVGVK